MAKQKLGLPKTLLVAFFTSFCALSCQSSPKPTDSVKSESVKPPEPVQLQAVDKAAAPAFDVTLSANKVPDGSIVEISLHPLMEIDITSVKVTFEGKEFPVFPSGPAKDLASLVVIPFNSKPRQSKIELVWVKDKSSGKVEIPVEVIDGDYPSEKLTVDEKKVNPPKKVMKRIAREVKEIGALYKKIDKDRHWSGPFSLPIESEVTSRFGNKRLFNGKMASFHQGLDLRARTPLPIHAPEGAKVAMAKDLYFTGNTVILDHGYGLFTIYGHMSRLDVKAGDKITKGQVLGLSGMTGRASGPHLHWGAVLLHEKFNPADLTRVPH
jgi:murein DD-endopeptidase MepM/ murein hydrolase activator NlpD